MDERRPGLRRPLGRGARWKLWIGAGPSSERLLPLAVVLVSSGRRGEAQRPPPASCASSDATERGARMFDLDGVSATIPLPLWVLALLVGRRSDRLPVRLGRARGALPDRGYALGAGRRTPARDLGRLVDLEPGLLPFSAGIDRSSDRSSSRPARPPSPSATVQELSGWLRANRRLLVAAECRLLDASSPPLSSSAGRTPISGTPVRGGEKPMDFAYLNAVVKSTLVPAVTTRGSRAAR